MTHDIFNTRVSDITTINLLKGQHRESYAFGWQQGEDTETQNVSGWKGPLWVI